MRSGRRLPSCESLKDVNMVVSRRCRVIRPLPGDFLLESQPACLSVTAREALCSLREFELPTTGPIRPVVASHSSNRIALKYKLKRSVVDWAFSSKGQTWFVSIYSREGHDAIWRLYQIRRSRLR